MAHSSAWGSASRAPFAARRRRLPSLHVRAHCHDGAGAPLAVRLLHGLRHRVGRGDPVLRADTRRRPALAPAVDQKEPDSSVCCLSCHRRRECNHILRAPRSEPLGCAIGWARLARSDVDQLFCMGLACRRAGVYVRCVLAVVRRPLCCLMDRRNGRYVGRVAASREPETFRVEFLRLVAGLGA